MNFLNRAFCNVTRKLSKTILLTLTFFLIGNLVIIGLGISNASESAKTMTRKKMRAVVTYKVDYDKVWRYADTIEDADELDEFYRNYPRINVDEVSVFLADPRVKIANATSSSMWYQDENKSVDYVHLNNKQEENMSSEDESYCNGKDCDVYVEPKFFVKANMFPGMIEFEDGGYQVIEGRFYSQQDINDAELVCLISENLANQNGLEVSDQITLSAEFLRSSLKNAGVSQDDLDVTLEIIGIYSHNSPLTPDSSNYDYASPYENPDNMILMPATTLYMAALPMQQKLYDYNSIGGDVASDRPEEDNMMQSIYIDAATLLLDDPLNVDKFVEDYSSSVNQFTSLDANNDEFNRLSKPLDTLSMYARFIITLVVVNAVVIITLVTALTLKTREYEIGVLLSIGASKVKVIAQFFVELAIVAVLGFSLSVISGSLIAKRIGNSILEAQIVSSGVEEEEDPYYYSYESIWSNNYATEISLDDLVNEYEVTISPLIIVEIYVMGLGIVLISVIIPSIMIMRYNPKKILMNTN